MKKTFAITTIAMVIFAFGSLTQNVQADTQPTATTRCAISTGKNNVISFNNFTVELCGSVAADPSHPGQYQFDAYATKYSSPSNTATVFGALATGGLTLLLPTTTVTDVTDDFTYTWSIANNANAAVQNENNNASTFDDALPGLSVGNYTVQISGVVSGQNNDGIPAGSSLLMTVPLTITTGASAGTTATITSVTATGQSDSGTNYPQYRMIAQLNGIDGGVISGGTQNADNSSKPNYTWTWSAKMATGPNAGTSYKLTNTSGFNVVNSFAPGSYYVQATATPTAGGSTVSTNNTTDPNATLNAGSLNGSSLALACTQSTAGGFSYQCVATPTINNSSCINGCSASGDYNYAWTVDGKALTANGFSVPVTFVAGSNTVSVVMKSNTDGSTIPQNISYTLDANGNITATNGNTAVSTADACTISISGVACVVGRVIGSVLGFVVSIITWITANFLLPITIGVIGMQVHTSAFSAVIIQEWVFIRNLCNIFFIATLIMVGLGTLFNVGTYDPKKILPKLVISALLINFSLAIAQAILGVADVLQAQFLGSGAAQSTVILQNLAYRLMTAPLKNVAAATTSSVTGLSAALFVEVVYFLVAIVAIFAFIALTAFLVIRIVALWLLLMTSPIAFATSFVPFGPIASLGKQWWNNFFKYAFFTPIIALLLHICALLADAQSTFTAGSINGQLSSVSGATLGSSLQASGTDILTSLLVAACLGAALNIANKMGIEGAKQVTAQFDKAKDKVFGVPKWAGNYALDRANRARRNLGSGLVNDKDGNVRTGALGFLGRSANGLLNPDAVLKSLSTSFDKKNKAAHELAQTRSDKLQFRNETGKGLPFGVARFGANNGVDNQADIKMLQKKEDEKVSQYMSGYNREQLREAFDDAKDNKTRAQILSARIQKGYLKRDIEDTGGPSDWRSVERHIQGQMAMLSPEAQKAFAKSMDHVGDDKKDLTLVGFNLSNADQAEKREEMLKSWSNDDLSKIKPDSLDIDGMSKIFAERVSRGGADVADAVTKKQLEKLKGENELSSVFAAMSASKALSLDTKMIEKLAPERIEEVGKAIFEKAKDLPASEFADKLSSEMMNVMDEPELSQVIAKMSASSIAKIKPDILRYRPQSREAILKQVEQNPKIVQDMSKAMREQFQDVERGELVSYMPADTLTSLDAAYVNNNSVKAAIVSRVRSNGDLVNKMSWPLLEKIDTPVSRRFIIKSMSPEKASSIKLGYLNDATLETELSQKVVSNPGMIDSMSNDVLARIKAEVITLNPAPALADKFTAKGL